jgi:YcaO-like protein with predicted kinase domain
LPTDAIDELMPAEREATIQDAIAKAHAAAAALGGRLQLEYLHHGPYPVTRSQFLRDGCTASEGVGKGEGDQAEASAVFEALEHYFLPAPNQAPGFTVKPIVEIASQKLLKADRLIRYVAESHPDALVGCAMYADLRDEMLTAWLPVFFVDPTYSVTPFEGDEVEYREYCRYGTSTGCAAGCTFTEAALHGLLESVERDALSRFFLKRFDAESGHEVRILDPGCLPMPLRGLIQELSLRLDGTVRIIDLTTNIGIPVYMAECRSASYPYGAFGCGCSLDPVYAVERAITELIQVDVEGRWNLVDNYFLAAAEKSPKHWRLPPTPDGELDRHELLRPECARLPQTPSDSLSIAIAATRMSGMTPLSRVTSLPELPVVTVSVYLAGSERFFLTRWGHHLRPTGLEDLRAVNVSALSHDSH